VWERSVRATHGFLTEDDIVALRPLVEAALDDEALELWVLLTDRVRGGRSLAARRRRATVPTLAHAPTGNSSEVGRRRRRRRQHGRVWSRLGEPLVAAPTQQQGFGAQHLGPLDGGPPLADPARSPGRTSRRKIHRRAGNVVRACDR
jgi:hypothetical protein